MILNCCISELLKIFSGFLIPLIAIITAWIAFQQMRIQRYRVKYDLFERRLKIYETVRLTVKDSIKHYGNLTDTVLTDFYESCRYSKFLFNNKIQRYISDIQSKIQDLEVLNQKLDDKNGLPIGDDRNKASEDKRKIIMWLTNEISNLEEQFSKFMIINKI